MDKFLKRNEVSSSKEVDQAASKNPKNCKLFAPPIMSSNFITGNSTVKKESVNFHAKSSMHDRAVSSDSGSIWLNGLYVRKWTSFYNKLRFKSLIFQASN